MSNVFTPFVMYTMHIVPTIIFYVSVLVRIYDGIFDIMKSINQA